MKPITAILFVAFITVSSFAQVEPPQLDSISAVVLQERIKIINTKIHNAFLNGTIPVYINDSFATPLTPDMYKMWYGKVKENERTSAIAGSYRFEPNFTNNQHQQSITCIVPKYRFVVGGKDYGFMSLYFVGIEDVEKVLENSEIELLFVLFSLAQKTIANNPALSNGTNTKNGEDKKNLKSQKLIDWVFGSYEVIVFPNELKELASAAIMVLEERLNLALCNYEPNKPCYLDPSFQNEIKHLGAYKPLAFEEVIQVPSFKYLGEFKDSVIVKNPHIRELISIQQEGAAFKIVSYKLEIYMKEKDFLETVPHWVKVLLID